MQISCWVRAGVATTKPHTAGAPDWKKLRALASRDGDLRLSHFRRVKQLGSGDVGLVDLVQIQVRLPPLPPMAVKCCLRWMKKKTLNDLVCYMQYPHLLTADCLQGEPETRFAMKTLEKREMVERNKVRTSPIYRFHPSGTHLLPATLHAMSVLRRLVSQHVRTLPNWVLQGPQPFMCAVFMCAELLLSSYAWRQVQRVLTEERILGAVDHPFLARLYGTIQTDTHLHFLMQVQPHILPPLFATLHPHSCSSAALSQLGRSAASSNAKIICPSHSSVLEAEATSNAIAPCLQLGVTRFVCSSMSWTRQSIWSVCSTAEVGSSTAC